MAEIQFGVICGNCGSDAVFMATCHHFRGTGHDWTLCAICLICRTVNWTASGCLDCGEAHLDAV